MDKIKTLGRIFIAIALVVFGVQHFMYGAFVAGLVPAWIPGRLFWAYFVGVAFFAAAAGILSQRLARPAATLLGVMFFLFVVLLHIPRIAAHSSDGNEWTSEFVALAMCGGAWILARNSPLAGREPSAPFLKLGRYFFAVAFVAFGIQHIVYARFAAGLGPPWFLGRPLWAYLTGAVFVAAGAAIFPEKRRDWRLLSWERSFFYSFCCFTFLASQPNCTIRARGPVDLRFWDCVEALWS